MQQMAMRAGRADGTQQWQTLEEFDEPSHKDSNKFLLLNSPALGGSNDSGSDRNPV